MKTSTLLCAALTLMGTAWLILAGSHRNQSKAQARYQLADFYFSVFDEEANPLVGYLVRIDGKLIGKTNKNGMVSKSALTIGNAPTITISLKSIEFRHEKPRETLLTLPLTTAKNRPAFSIHSALCIDYITCDDDIHTIKPGKSAPEPRPNRSSAVTSALPKRYDFMLTKSAELGPKLSLVVRHLDRQLKGTPTSGPGLAVNVSFSHIDSEKHGLMLRVTGKRQGSGSVDNDFAFLLPLKDDPEAAAKEVLRLLSEMRPGGPATNGKKFLKMSFKEPVNSSYEIYAGGLSGEIVNANSWNLMVPASGRFFLTVVSKGKIVARKFFDAGSADQITFDAK